MGVDGQDGGRAEVMIAAAAPRAVIVGNEWRWQPQFSIQGPGGDMLLVAWDEHYGSPVSAEAIAEEMVASLAGGVK